MLCDSRQYRHFNNVIFLTKKDLSNFFRIQESTNTNDYWEIFTKESDIVLNHFSFSLDTLGRWEGRAILIKESC